MGQGHPLLLDSYKADYYHDKGYYYHEQRVGKCLLPLLHDGGQPEDGGSLTISLMNII